MNTENRKEGALFDLDGCLANTLIVWHMMCVQELRENGQGVKVSSTDLMHTVVPELIQIKEFGHPDPEAFRDGVLRRVREAKSSIRLHDGVLPVLDYLQQRGILQMLVTSSFHDWADGILRQNGSYHFNGKIVSRTDVTKRKPDPEPIFLALQRLGLEPHQAIMVGDSHVDIQAANAAGVTSVLFYPKANQPFYAEEDVYGMQPSPSFVITQFRQVLDILGVQREK